MKASRKIAIRDFSKKRNGKKPAKKVVETPSKEEKAEEAAERKKQYLKKVAKINAGAKIGSARPRRCGGCGEISSDLVRCRECRGPRCRACVKIGNCHNDRFSKGYYGQTYSGANGRGVLY